MKKYKSIRSKGKAETLDIFEPGDRIVIQEKLDGSNASVRFQDGELFSFGRKCELDETINLMGFYEFAKRFEEPLRQIAEGERISHLTFFGEWLCKNKLGYGDFQRQFYLFDVYDEEQDCYLSFKEVVVWAVRLGTPTVPVCYEGPFQSIEHIESFVGKTVMASGGVGEGIVIKNESRLHRGKPLFVKWVTSAFEEKMKQRVRVPKEMTEAMVWFEQFLTPARIEKNLFKLRNEGVVKEFTFSEFPSIIRVLIPRLIEDILEEEGDDQLEDFNIEDIEKMCGKLGANVLRNLVKSEQSAA